MPAKNPITGCRADTLMGLWLYGNEDGFEAMVDRAWKVVDTGQLTEIYLARSIEMNDERAKTPYTIDQNGIAHLAISGPMTKFSTSMSSLFGGTSTMEIRDALREIRQQNSMGSIKGVFVEMDSGGGTVDGTAELAESIRKTAEVMPVHVHAPDCMASAALWVGTQGTRVTCGPVASVGSLGTMLQLFDRSVDKNASTKPVVIRSGKFKGVGAPGVPLTKEVTDDLQRRCDHQTEVFADQVFKARGISGKKNEVIVEEIMTAKVFIGQDAVRVGLVDAVCSQDDAYNNLKQAVERGPVPAKKPAAIPYRSTKMALTEQQLAVATKLTGVTLSNDNADVELFGALVAAKNSLSVAEIEAGKAKAEADTLKTELSATKARIPAAPNLELLAGRAEIFAGKAEVLTERGVLTSAQLTGFKTLLAGKDGKTPNVALLSGSTWDTSPANEVFQTLSVGKPHDLFKENTRHQPAPRTVPGADASGGFPTFTAHNETRKENGFAPLTRAQYDAKFPAATV